MRDASKEDEGGGTSRARDWLGASWLGALLAGVVALVVFEVGLARLGADAYRDRDDGIITVSHAVNFADWGTIGPNPSGERVEGFSAPGHFLAALVAYELTGATYSTYARGQTLVATFLIGVLAFGLLARAGPGGAEVGVGERVVLVGVVATLLAADPSFLGWHASGMENALLHAALLATVVALDRLLETGRGAAFVIAAAGFASIVRVESVVRVAPAVAVFAVAWARRHGNGQDEGRGGQGVAVGAAIAASCAAVHAGRWAYFGDVLPNTAHAQRISPVDRLAALATFDGDAWSAAEALLGTILTTHLGVVALAALVVLALARDARRSFRVGALATFVGVALVVPLAFGPSRIDPTRTTTPLALAAALLFVLAVARSAPRRGGQAMLVAGGVALAVATTPAPYALGFDPAPFLRSRAELLAVARAHRIPRPTLANADLGAISWHKDFNVVDLGRLGSPILVRLRSQEAFATYFFELAAPDLVELHEAWACAHHFLLEDPRFEERYAEIRSGRSPLQERFCAAHPTVRNGVWVRRAVVAGAPTPERQFLERAARDLSLATFAGELARCRDTAGSREPAWARCLHVTRTAYRFLPELAALDLYEDLLVAFERSPSMRWDQAILGARTRPAWWTDAVAFVEDTVARASRRGGRAMDEGA